MYFYEVHPPTQEYDRFLIDFWKISYYRVVYMFLYGEVFVSPGWEKAPNY